MGGPARTIIATSVGYSVKPRFASRTVVNGTSSPITAKDGKARQALAEVTTSHENRPEWPIHKPRGRATRAASRRETPLSARCSRSREGIPLAPCQWAGSDSQAAVAPIRSIASGPSSAHGPSGGPRRQQPLEQHEAQIGDDREADRQQAANENLRREVAVIAVQDVVAQAAEAVAQDRRDCHQADRRDAGQAQARHDERHRKRQLHAPPPVSYTH